MKKIIVLSIVVLSLVLTSCTGEEKGSISSKTEDIFVEKIEKLENQVSDSNKKLDDTLKLFDEQKGKLSDALKTIEEQKSKIDELSNSNEEKAGSQGGSSNSPASASLMLDAIDVVNKLKLEDYNAVAAYADPSIPVIFTPYQNVTLGQSISLSVSGIQDIPNTTLAMIWGTQPGSGEDILMTPSMYLSQYVNDIDFANAPIISQNHTSTTGNLINNLDTVFAGKEYVEFYYPQIDPANNGFDWRSLTIIFDTSSGSNKLVGVISGRWTP